MSGVSPLKPNVGPSMVSFRHLYVHMYSRLPDGEHVVTLTLHPNGYMIQLHVYNRHGEAWKCVLSEENMTQLRLGCHETLSWQSFFDLLQKAFAEHTIVYTHPNVSITIKHERQTDAVPIPPFSTSLVIPVDPCPSDSQDIYHAGASMVSFVSLRANDKRELERLENIGRHEETVLEELTRTRQELKVLENEKAAMTSIKSYTDIIQRENAQLLAKDASLKPMIEAATSSTATVDLLISRIKDPLVDVKGYIKPHDAKLLHLVKCMSPSFQANSGNKTPTSNGSAAPLVLSAVELNTASSPVGTGRPFDVFPSLDEATLDKLHKEVTDNAASALLYRLSMQVEDWEFDVIKFETACIAAAPKGAKQGDAAGALFYMGFFVMCRLGLMVKFNLSERCLLQWLSMVEAGYQKNTFHNSIHASDVLQALFHMLTVGDGIRRLGLKEADQLALVLGAMIHDFNHPGTNNAFQVRSRSDLACCFADESPLEQMHFVSVMELMKLQRYNLLRMVDPETRSFVEDRMGYLLLATDLARHDTIVAAFRLRLQEWACSQGPNLGEGGAKNPQDALLVMCLLLKAADISNCARKEDVYMQWAQRLQSEYQKQGALETSAGIPVSPFMGNNITFHTSMAKLQIAFLNAAAVPTYAELSEILPKLRVTGEHLSRNRNRWANAEENEALGRV